MTDRYRTTKKVDAYRIKDLVLMPKSDVNPEFKNKAFILNESAALLWDCLESDASFEDLLNEMVKHYEVDHQRATRDITFFLQTLEYIGLANTISEDESSAKSKPKKDLSKVERLNYTSPRVFLYDLYSDEEIQFGPHVRGETWVRRASRLYGSGCGC